MFEKDIAEIPAPVGAAAKCTVIVFGPSEIFGAIMRHISTFSSVVVEPTCFLPTKIPWPVPPVISTDVTGCSVPSAVTATIIIRSLPGPTVRFSEQAVELHKAPLLFFKLSKVIVDGTGLEIVYTRVCTVSGFPAVSFAKNLRVVVADIGIGELYTVLDVVGVELFVV
jgi:hypothetical protein